MYEGKTPGVKIGFYNPPDVARAAQSPIASVEDFVDECMPSLRGAEVVDVAEASGADVCFYDLVADDDFILGPVPGVAGVFTGVGWRGTGYKFAPWAGRVLAQLALQQGTVYDIRRFAPGRFAGGGRDRHGRDRRYGIMSGPAASQPGSPGGSGPGRCSARRAMSSSWSVAATSRQARTSRRWSWTSRRP